MSRVAELSDYLVSKGYKLERHGKVIYVYKAGMTPLDWDDLEEIKSSLEHFSENPALAYFKVGGNSVAWRVED